MSAQIAIDGLVIDLDEQITYNFQGLDVGDVSLTKSNYTSTFRIPKTQDIVAKFQGLGIAGDRSEYPYKINNVQCMDDYAVVYTGTLIIMRTDDLYYHATVLGASFEIASELGDLTVADLGWDIFGHIKEPNTVSSFIQYSPNNNFIYVLAKFGSFINFDDTREDDDEEGTGTWVNVDELVPAIRVQSLLNDIFTNILGMQYDLGGLDISNKYITFPYPPYLEAGEDGQTVLTATKLVPNNIDNWAGTPPLEFGGYQTWSSFTNNPSYFTLNSSDNWSFMCQEEGVYILNIDNYNVLVRFSNYRAVCKIYLNDEEIALFGGINWDYEETNIFRTLIYGHVGDRITIKLFRERVRSGFPEYWTMPQDGFQVRIIQPSVKDEAIRSIYGLKLLDIIKEVMWLNALSMVKDGNTIRFIGLDQRIDRSPQNVIDWSDKYIRRREESYDIGYAQNNWLRHKYVEDGADYYDLNIPSYHKNTQLSKTIVQSNLYVKNQDLERIIVHDDALPVSVAVMPTFTGDEIDKIKAENRNFFIEIVSGFHPNIKFGSGTLPIKTISGGSVNTVPNTTSEAFRSNDKWPVLEYIVKNTRVHKIEMLLSMIDIASLDLTKVYYFEQEQSYYMMSKLQYKAGEVAKGEFVKINYVPPEPPFVSANFRLHNNTSPLPITVSFPYDPDVVLEENEIRTVTIRRRENENFIITTTQGAEQVDSVQAIDEGSYNQIFSPMLPIEIPSTVQGLVNVVWYWNL